ncbi:hypothetical protein L207DRAFT_152965 [Hyaloscypha variabilis F]|uniref:Uncharacterized protein n=1 Tax=Hyaloscypha variabilis (strain UAMH 11265 / GT02V1 / F) TaxID=1149755 RepID=A0A2J6S934_HYAVF|nr:hypothetical protein L207DRAFT_152965 [Hyaloscypha variabilis F]
MGSPWAWGNIGEVWTTDVCGLQGENRQRRGEGNGDDSIDLRYIDFEGAVGSLSIDSARSLVALRALRALLVQGRTFLSFLFSPAHLFFGGEHGTESGEFRDNGFAPRPLGVTMGEGGSSCGSDACTADATQDWVEMVHLHWAGDAGWAEKSGIS